MPAVQLSRLSSEIDFLSRQFLFPVEFQQGLHALLERYATLVYRPGQLVKATRNIQEYHVPPLVLNRLEQRLSQLCQANPQSSLSLADILWKDPYLECRHLSAYILGQYPLVSPDPVVNRIYAWCQPKEDAAVIQAILIQAGARLRVEQPLTWIVMVQKWLEQPDTFYQKTALKALLPLIMDPQFENLPPIFQVISPLVKNPPSALQGELKDVLSALAVRSPGETSYFLKQILVLTKNTSLTRIVRKIIPELPTVMQNSLRNALQSLQGNEEDKTSI